MKIAIVFSGHLRDTCENRMLPQLTKSFLSNCQSEFLCDIFIHTWTKIDKYSNISSYNCLQTFEKLLSPKGVVHEHQFVNANKTFGWAHENLQGIRLNIGGIHGGLQLMKHHATLFGEYDVAMRIRSDMFGARMQTRKDFKEQFPDSKEWGRVKNKITTSPKLLFECMRPRRKRIDFCIFGVPAVFWHQIDYLFTNFENVSNSYCENMLISKNWPVYSENIIACSMMNLNMSVEQIGR